jgi:hypothetical protein
MRMGANKEGWMEGRKDGWKDGRTDALTQFMKL